MRSPITLGAMGVSLSILLILSGCNQPYAASPVTTNTPIHPTQLFTSPIPEASTPDIAATFTAAAVPTESLLTTPQSTATPQPSATEVSEGATEPIIGATEAPSGATEASSGGDDSFALEELAIQSLPKASFQYIVPLTLKLDETFVVELDMSRSLSGPELLTKMVTANALVTSTAQACTLVAPEGQPVQLEGGQVEVTQYMQAKLYSENRDAFEVQALQEPTQYLGSNQTVKWQWAIKARKSGPQKLIFVIYQQARSNDQTHWHTLETERRAVQVNVTFNQRLGAFGLAGIAVLVIVMVAGSLLWRYTRSKPQAETAGRARRGRGSLLPALPGHVFISYRRSDSADNAGRIYDSLVEEFGTEPIFKDVDSIPLGTDFREYLNQKVSECNVLLAIIGDEWLNASDSAGNRRLENPDDFVRIEIESALARRIPVIPLLVRGARMPAEAELPPSLKNLAYRNGMPIRPDPDFHHDMNRLISALETYLRAGPSQPGG